MSNVDFCVGCVVVEAMTNGELIQYGGVELGSEVEIDDDESINEITRRYFF